MEIPCVWRAVEGRGWKPTEGIGDPDEAIMDGMRTEHATREDAGPATPCASFEKVARYSFSQDGLQAVANVVQTLRPDHGLSVSWSYSAGLARLVCTPLLLHVEHAVNSQPPCRQEIQSDGLDTADEGSATPLERLLRFVGCLSHDAPFQKVQVEITRLDLVRVHFREGGRTIVTVVLRHASYEAFGDETLA
jgi:hypothetical protein